MKVRKIIYYVLLTSAILLISLSLLAVSRILRGDGRGEDAYERLQRRMDDMPEADLPAEDGAGPEAADSVPDTVPELSIFEPLMQAVRQLCEEYPDCAGWIRIPGTAVDYPIVRSGGERGHAYWLTHLYNGEENRIGSIFLDRRTPQPGEADNTIIYGHNLRNGSMFRSLSYYLKEEGFFDEHPYFIVILEDDVLLCRIFSVREVDTSSVLYTSEFVPEAVREAFIEEANSKNGVNTPFSPSPDARFITLSTCSYGSGGSRLTVAAEAVSLKKIN